VNGASCASSFHGYTNQSIARFMPALLVPSAFSATKGEKKKKRIVREVATGVQKKKKYSLLNVPWWSPSQVLIQLNGA
jgi:hypothetical protein